MPQTSRAGTLKNNICQRQKRAFTLIEILFAVIIITVIATAIATSSINNISYAIYNKQLAEAHLLAESKLAEVKATDKKLLITQGIEKINNTEYLWRIQDSVVSINDKNEKYNIELKELTITVNWQSNTDAKKISIKEHIWQDNSTKDQL